MPLSPDRIRRLLRPRSVAIIGASPSPGALGAAVLRNLERAGYAGRIHLVNPRRTEIAGRACIPDVAALPDGVDCAVLAIPRDGVLPSLRACAARGVGGVIIFSIGFAEEGPDGLAAQAEITALAQAHGIVVEGPNCLGLVNYVDGAPLTFVETPARRIGEHPGIAIVSQSGAMAAVLAVDMHARDLDLSYTVSTGNEAASGVEDYLEYMLDDRHTAVVALIVEQFRDPPRFLALARRARGLGKRLVLLHPGSSAAARRSAATHTGAMAGDHEVMRTVVAHAGVIVADTIEELLDISEMLVRGAAPRPGGGVMLLTESGAFKALALDQAERLGLSVPPLSQDSDARLRAELPGFIPAGNPLDLTAQALVDPTLYERTLAAVVDDPGFAVVVLGLIMTDPATSLRKLPAVADALRRLAPAVPVIVAALDAGAEVAQPPVDDLRALGVPFVRGAERVFRALARFAPPAEAAPAPGEDLALALVPGDLTEARSKDVLRSIGIAVPPGRQAATLGEASAIAAEIGYPVALKAQSPSLPHKSEAGGVVLHLADEAALAQGWARLHRDVAAHCPGLALEGVLVEAMGARGVELIVGARRDPHWGPVLLVGLGGVAAEALHDVRLLPADLAPHAIAAELRRLRGAALLTGFRGSLPADIDAVAAIAARLGALLIASPAIEEAEINPVVACPAGQGAIALDALMRVR